MHMQHGTHVDLRTKPWCTICLALQEDELIAMPCALWWHAEMPAQWVSSSWLPATSQVVAQAVAEPHLFDFAPADAASFGAS
jgi:hypothetical protein